MTRAIAPWATQSTSPFSNDPGRGRLRIRAYAELGINTFGLTRSAIAERQGGLCRQHDTADLYCYFDCTVEAEFLYACVRRTVEHDLPREIEYLKRHDEAMLGVMNIVEMPDRLAQNLITYIRQNNGSLGRKRREKELEALTDQEVAAIEQIVRREFDGFELGELP
jgi:hypothetical protein